MSNETIAWKICYTENEQYRTVLSEHNSVGDYRAIDPMASSIALCAAPVSAEPVAYLDIGEGGYMDLGTDLTEDRLAQLPKGRHMLSVVGTYGLHGYTAAPVTVQPDLTQQTLDDVKAGIPARDAEIEALRKEIDTLRAQQPVSGADGLLESPTRGMSLGQRIAHVGGRENAQGYIEFGSPMAVDALIQHILRDLTTSTPQGAFQARYRMPGGKWSSWGAVTCGVKGHEQELRYLETEGQHIGGFDAWIKREYPHLGPIGDCVAIAREAWSAALAQQDAEKVDAERWRAYRASAAADDAGFLQRALNAIEAMGLEDGQLPSEDQIDAAIDAARKEHSNG